MGDSLCLALCDLFFPFVTVMNGVRDVLGVEVLACGTETPTPGLSASALDAFVRAQLEATRGDPTPRMHTLVLTAAAERALDASKLLSEAWHRLHVAPGVTALSLLRVA